MARKHSRRYNYLQILTKLGKSVPHHCAAPPDGTNFTIDGIDLPPSSNITYYQCSIGVIHTTDNTSKLQTLPCIYGMQYTERKYVSFVPEFDLVCDREALSDFPQTLLILGQALGALILPYFSDTFGRKPVHVLSHSILLVIGISIAFSPNYLVFAILRLLIGAIQRESIFLYLPSQAWSDMN
ncbi:hypothetical protein LOTGIDRAFT_152165 [Lottia gigantea]|uniref:Major facilitator superfamily (MFS) profile domain-containing protein n=1 Tax=Lottia gigantea TaxID=225164 RepID=V4BCG9_LOTGI|nr:hypothetical protein LOTGIDRAFT_152165 [Lottia gigantea]ESP05326.1 hypothetical protein LOTGIDRAFT_152165 [Lottia gigantea]